MILPTAATLHYIADKTMNRPGANTVHTLDSASAHVDWLFQLLEAQGQGDYIGESISQLEHCLQAAHFARLDSAPEETVIAALLHDVGQFLPIEAQRNVVKAQTGAKQEAAEGGEMLEGGQSVGRMGHDTIGQKWLDNHGWPRKVGELVGAHVVAKRYLTATSASYLDSLSNASKASLKHQGGPFTPTEVKSFEDDPLWREKVQLRIWDDQAKVVGLETWGLDQLRDSAVRVLLRGQA